MAQLTFTNNKIDSSISGSVDRWQSKINTNGVCDSATLCAEVAANLKESAAFCETFLKSVSASAQSHLRDGERVLLAGLCHLELVGEGAFDTEDEAWNLNKHRILVRAIPYDEIKKAAADIVPTNTLPMVSIQLLGAQDATTLEQNAWTIGHTLLCQGKGMKITQSNADEGIFLVKGANEYKGTITANTAGTIDCTFASTVPAGEGYTLVVRGRAGFGTNRTLVTAQISNFVVKAAA